MSRGLLAVLVVLVVIGGGAAIAVTGLSGSSPVPLVTTSSRPAGPGGPAPSSQPAGGPNTGALAESCRADASSVATAVQTYDAANGSFPKSLSDLVPNYLREAPSSAHYMIVVDSSGRVGVLPPHSSFTGSVPPTADFGLHPELCDSVPR